ncbi:urease accessory protein UreD [Ureaplasma canigenitalium]|uniref:urease accessory protein UreD n=1 Tax=Ureaplasma canigenitalium TaxID=42092 RepID=UPI0004E139A7|nr:urease accessory protein UreD [Ureaplasma canigenitalium]
MRASDKQIATYAAYLYIKVEKIKDSPDMSHTVYFTNFYRSSKPLYIDEQDWHMPCFQLITMGGGYISGERYRQDFEIKDNARCIITTQSSAKAYKSVNDKSSLQYTNITVGKNAVLEYLSDNVIVYENGRFEQFNNFHITKTSTLIYTECFGPGWSPFGISYMYEKMYLNTKIFMDGEIVLFDNLKFQPHIHDESAFGIMGGYHYCGTMVAFNENITEHDIITVRDLIKETFKDYQMEIGVSSFDVPGLAVRVLANTYFDVEKVTKVAHSYLRKRLWNKKPLYLRKF